MKICHIITGLGFGGAEKLLVNLTNIHCEEHQIFVIYLKDIKHLADTFDSRIELRYVPLGLNSVCAVRAHLYNIKPDIIHTHLGHADLIGMLAARGLSSKLFCTMHNIWFKWNWFDTVIFQIYRILLRTIARRCQIIAISQSVADHVKERLGVNKHNIHLLYNGIPSIKNEQISTPETKTKLGLSDDNLNILFVGRLSKQKSVETLILAAHKLKHDISNFKIIIIGDGDLKESLEKQVYILGLSEHVEFRGTTHQPEEYFQTCDLFILPSIFEGMGIVILEAFRSFIPVVATNIEGPKELIKNDRTGKLFEPLNYNKLAEIILELYHNPEKRISLAEEAYRFFYQNFRIEDYADKLEQIYSPLDTEK